MIIIIEQEKGTYLLSIQILLGPNKVSLYLTLTLRNLTLPKNLHLSYIPHLRVFSIRKALSKELSEFLLPVFSSSFYLWGFLETNSCFHLALNTHESNYIYFTLKQKFCGFVVDIQKQRTQIVKKISEPNIKILHFSWHLFAICGFLSQIAAFT